MVGNGSILFTVEKLSALAGAGDRSRATSVGGLDSDIWYLPTPLLSPGRYERRHSRLRENPPTQPSVGTRCDSIGSNDFSTTDGNSSVNVEPLPNSLCTITSPPI